MPLGYRARFIDLGTLEKEKKLEYNSVLNERGKKKTNSENGKIVLRLTALLGVLNRLLGSGCVPLAPCIAVYRGYTRLLWLTGVFFFSV